MFYLSPNEAPNKINKATANLRTPQYSPKGNQFRKKTIYATICLLTIITLGIVISIGPNKNTVSASTVNGVGVGIYWDQPAQTKLFHSSGDLWKQGQTIY